MFISFRDLGNVFFSFNEINLNKSWWSAKVVFVRRKLDFKSTVNRIGKN